MLIVESTLHRYIFTVLLCRCVLAVATKIRHLTSNGKSEAEAWNASSVQLVKAAEVKDICEIERETEREIERERERDRETETETETETERRKCEQSHLFCLQAHCEAFILRKFVEKVQSVTNRKVQEALNTLLMLHGIHTVTRYLGDYLVVDMPFHCMKSR